MSVLRVYLPGECDSEAGVPLDWECCDKCEGRGRQVIPGHLLAGEDRSRVCPSCDGHGSLKAAALSGRGTWADAEHLYPGDVVGLRRLAVEQFHRYGAVLDEEKYGVGATFAVNIETHRCEGCGHPMSEGTWEPELPEHSNTLGFTVTGGELASLAFEMAEHRLRRGESLRAEPTLYSPCDEGCRHSGALRFHPTDGSAPWVSDVVRNPFVMPDGGTETAGDVAGRTDGLVEASWRPVDVRCLSWAHDLRPEMLAVLCLRCFVERTS